MPIIARMPSLEGASLAVFVIRTIKTSINVHIASIVNAFHTVIPVFGFKMTSSDFGTLP